MKINVWTITLQVIITLTIIVIGNKILFDRDIIPFNKFLPSTELENLSDNYSNNYDVKVITNSFYLKNDSYLIKETTNSYVIATPVRLSGKCSHYSDYFHGRLCADGKTIFNQFSNYVASCELPFGTKVKITNVKNGKTVIGVVVDRGPFNVDDGGRAIFPLTSHKDRILDVSKSLAIELDMIYQGVIDIKMEIL
jgi:rare lipoprotein A